MLHSGQQRGRDVEGPGLRLSRVSGVGCPSPANQRMALRFAWPLTYKILVPGTEKTMWNK